MVKALKNLLLRNQKADDLETWYAASGAWLLQTIIVYDLKLATDDLVPWGLYAPPGGGAIYMYLIMTSKRFLLNLQQMGKV